ncbi:colipase_C domain-containing protein [Nephila pilipes]|uniref:Colipase_C domain-containing protein n=1 Tax=Nephila pilipes TaxID=299642 RepID=A0A8X6THJ7_NEPPI|nr:colipase_C domain-containing protein [Nephila pilipes]
MKTLLLCFVGVLCVVVTFGESCFSQEDCKDGECCTGGITPWLKGRCKNLAEEGESCDPGSPSTGKYFLNCPCRSGLICDDSVKVMGSIKCIRK